MSDENCIFRIIRFKKRNYFSGYIFKSWFVNNVFVAGAYAEGYTYRWEYSGSIPKADLHAGSNQLLVKLADNGGLTAFDMQVSDNSAGLPLVLTCPSNLSVPKEADACSAVVAFHSPI